jgi:hypothetical protein
MEDGSGRRRTITMATSAVVRTRLVGVIVTPDVRARGGDVALVLVGSGDTRVTRGFVGRRKSSGEGDEGR